MTANPDRPIAGRLFTDDRTRPVIEDATGRQYVVDDDSNMVYGVWLPPADEPMEVQR
jgi:hypothetical protein